MSRSIDFNATGMTKMRKSTRSSKPFVPLKELLCRNHDDRVHEYLDKMKNLSIDEMLNTSLKTSKVAPKTTTAQDDTTVLRNQSDYSPDPETRGFSNLQVYSKGRYNPSGLSKKESPKNFFGMAGVQQAFEFEKI